MLRCYIYILLVIAALLYACAYINAQATNSHVAGSLTTTQGLGYTNPAFGGSVGFDKQITRHFTFTLDASFERARKVVGGGHLVSITPELRGYVNNKVFILGGLGIASQSTSSYSKTAIRPRIGVGFNFHDKATFTAAYRFPELGNYNKARGFDAALTFYAKRKEKNWGLFQRTEVSVLSFESNCAGNGVRCQTLNGSSIKFEFGVARF